MENGTGSMRSGSCARGVGASGSSLSTLNQRIGDRALSLAARPPSRGWARQYGYGSLIVDLFGIIRFCSASCARLMGLDAEEILDRPVQTVLADLPFTDRTPGYNLTIARTMFPAGRWHPLRMTHVDGESLAMDASLQVCEIQGRRLFFVELRCVDPGPLRVDSVD